MATFTATDLGKYILGTWILESYQSFSIDGSDGRHPFGPDSKGILMYTADGYMSAQIMRPDRPHFHTRDLRSVDTDELATAADGYFAYSGPYTVSEQGLVVHYVDVSLVPNWVGETQYRAAEIGDSRLQLSPTQPVLNDGQRRNLRFVWRRP